MNQVLHSIKRLWPLIRPYKKRLYIIFFLGFIISLCNVAQTALIKVLFSDVIELKQETVLILGHEFSSWLIPFIFPALYLLWGTARYTHYFILTMVNERVVADVRVRAVEQSLKLNLGFHSKFESGSGGLMSRILNDTQVLQQGLTFFGDILREPLIAIALLSYMIYLDWQLTLALLAFLPVFVGITRQISRSLRKYGHVNRQAMEAVTADIKENLDGLRVIQSFNLENAMGARLRQSMNHYLATRRTIVSREEAVSPLNEFFASLLVMGLVLYMMSLILDSKATGGDFLAFVFAAGQLQNPIKRLQESFVRVQQTVVVTDRLFGLIESTDRVPQAIAPVPFPQDWKTIEFRNVKFRYDEEAVLKGISFKVNRGEIVALVGSSGSGKSTLVNLLERFYDPTEGDILVDGISLKDFDLTELRSKIALVTQDVFLFRDSIAANIRSGRGDSSERPGDDALVKSSAKHAHANFFIEKTPSRYNTSVGERGGTLSGGEKQRISIARAFFKNAPILILDEATSALDSVSELEVQRGLQELMIGRTVFVIAHRLSTVRTAHRILVLKQGEIVEEGSHEDLIARSGEYAHFHRIQTSNEQA
ncbi:MAG: ATP-binding cassette domain-containing protein [Bdellovibrionales bacterium]|nr:ATP-binding cassette domain-containing protein [Bdellovibrionales bacterium]